MSLTSFYKKIPKIQLLFYFLLFLLFVTIISRLNLKSYKSGGGCKEGFGVGELEENLYNEESIIIKEDTEMYDRFYATIYDELLFSKVKNDF